MTSFDALLELQATDTRIDQLRHRLATLPERAALATNDEALVGLGRATAAVEERREALARDQKRVEDELAGVEEKISHVNDQLYGQGLTSPKEAQALQEELAALKRRSSDLEDQVLELLTAAEPVDAELVTAAAERAALDERGQSLLASLAEGEAAVSAELAEAEAGRAGSAAQVPDELLAQYEALRPQLGGVAVARLQGGACGGCHLQLAAAEVDRIKHLPDDQLATCEECGRLLVH